MDKQRTKCTPCKCFRCGPVDHLVSKCPKPPKYNEKQQKQVRFNERGNFASQKESKDVDDDNDQKIYAYMARMSGNEESYSRYFGDSL